MIKLLQQLADAGITSVVVVPGKKEVQFGASVTDAQKASVKDLIANYDWSQAAADAYNTELSKTFAKALMTSTDPRDVLFRGLLYVMLDEINALRTKTGLANRNMGQLIAAVQSKIDSVATNV